MDSSIFGILWALIERASLLLVVFFLLFHIKFFNRMLSKKLSIVDQVVLAVIFGLFAIYGTYTGIQTAGAIANIRNLGPMIAGLLGGPWVGLGAGLIGGVHRYFMGGFTAVPCAIGTITSGLAGGLLFMLWKGNIGIWKPTLFAFLMEAADMGLLLLMAHPFQDALKLVSIIALPMILADTIGILIFAFLLKELKQAQASGK
ncbi:MAG: LytS/YhcK type 5TM receptor domain-containing protein [Dehalococcoidia bacterium]|jgi:sigma-B regulation protein RsbU (phosphoserine phosphatase)